MDSEYSGANFFQGWDFFTVRNLTLTLIYLSKLLLISAKQAGDPTGGFVTSVLISDFLQGNRKVKEAPSDRR